MGKQWAYISLIKDEEGMKLGLFEGDYYKCEYLTKEIARIPLNRDHCFSRVEVSDGECTFRYSLDNEKFKTIDDDYSFKVVEGRWIGAKVGVLSINSNIMESDGFAEFDWFRVE